MSVGAVVGASLSHWSLSGSPRDQPRALKEASYTCKKHLLDPHSILEAEQELKSTVLGSKSYPLNGKEDSGKSTGCTEVKSDVGGKGARASQTSHVFLRLRKSFLLSFRILKLSSPSGEFNK